MDLIKPEVPNAQANRGPDLFLESMRTGLAGFAQFAQIRRQTESDVARMAFAERQAQEAHALDKRKLDMAAEMIPLQRELTGSQISLNKAHAYSYVTDADRKMLDETNELAFLNKFYGDVDKSKLKDPSFENSDTAQWFDNLDALKRKYEMTPDAKVKQALKAFEERASQHTVSVPHVIYGDNGKVTVAEGNPETVTVGQAVNGLRNADTRDQWYDRLKAGGYITAGKKGRDGFLGMGVEKPTPDAPNKLAQRLINQSNKPPPSMDDPAAPDQSAQKVRVKSPSGEVGVIPASQLSSALAQGYQQLQ